LLPPVGWNTAPNLSKRRICAEGNDEFDQYSHCSCNTAEPPLPSKYHQHSASNEMPQISARPRLPTKRNSMASARTIRDPTQDHLLTPQNSAMIILDFQPTQISCVTSRDQHTLVRNVVSTAQLGRLFGLPMVLSTINVKTGINEPMIKPLSDVFPGIEP